MAGGASAGGPRRAAVPCFCFSLRVIVNSYRVYCQSGRLDTREVAGQQEAITVKRGWDTFPPPVLSGCCKCSFKCVIAVTMSAKLAGRANQVSPEVRAVFSQCCDPTPWRDPAECCITERQTPVQHRASRPARHSQTHRCWHAQQAAEQPCRCARQHSSSRGGCPRCSTSSRG